jgi:hypothetical protein
VDRIRNCVAYIAGRVFLPTLNLVRKGLVELARTDKWPGQPVSISHPSAFFLKRLAILT